MSFQTRQHLNEPDPHASEARNAHESQQNDTGSCPGNAKNASDENSVNVGLRERRSNGKSSDQEHNGWGEHDRENVPWRPRG